MLAVLLTSDIVTRLLWSLAIILSGLALYRLINRAILYRAERNGSADTANIPGARPGIPTILYFTTPDCFPCKTVQRPALQKIQNRLGDNLQVIEVDAQAQPDLASRWGVMSVPTTFILDSSGRLLHVNHGATRAEKLLKQIQA